MDDKSFANEVKNSLSASREGIAELVSRRDELKSDISSGKFSPQHVAENLQPKISELNKSIEQAKAEAERQAYAICDRYAAQLEAEDALDGEKLTPDIALLSCGVSLNERDIDNLIEKHRDNPTMIQILARYANERGLKTQYNYVGNSGRLRFVRDVRGLAESYTKWIDDAKNGASILDKYFAPIV